MRVASLAVLALVACGDGGPTGAVPSAGDAVLHRLTQDQVNRSLAELFSRSDLPDVVLPRDIPVHGFENNAIVRDASPYVVESIQRDLDVVTRQVVRDGGAWLACDLDTAPDAEACARQTLEPLVQRAWRRPVTEDELTWLLGLYAAWLPSEGASQAMILTLQVVLQSPDFQYLVEADRPGGLDGFEIASRMSYFLWNTMPDAELFRAAAAGELGSVDSVRAQARRMIQDPRARQSVVSFHRQWLDFRGIDRISVDEDVYLPQLEGDEEAAGGVLAQVRISFEEEFDAFVETSFYGPGTFGDLLTSRNTWVSDATASLYGARMDRDAAPRTARRRLGADIVDVRLWPGQLNPEERAGFLTTGGFLASHAHAVQPSPVLRGVFVRERMLCLETPKPPDDVPPLEEQEEATVRTNRERYAVHTEQPACSGCHIGIDGAGFPFENYDSLGAWRDQDNGYPVDASGELVGTDVDGPVTDAVALAETIAGSRVAHDCATTQWFRYAMHRSELPEDDAALAALQQRFWDSGGFVPDLLVDIVTSDFFLGRTGGGR